MFALFAPISFTGKLRAFKTEIKALCGTAFANWAVAPATATLAVESARAFREYFEPFDSFSVIAAFIVNPSNNLEMTSDQI